MVSEWVLGPCPAAAVALVCKSRNGHLAFATPLLLPWSAGLGMGTRPLPCLLLLPRSAVSCFCPLCSNDEDDEAPVQTIAPCYY